MTILSFFDAIHAPNITEGGRAIIRNVVRAEQASAAYWHKRSMVGSVDAIVYCQDRSASHAEMARRLMGIE